MSASTLSFYRPIVTFKGTYDELNELKNKLNRNHNSYGNTINKIEMED
jgi:hypothetical protein